MTPISVIVYINGTLFYPSSITVTATRNELARFQVELPGIPEWDLLPPRSHGVVFYTDSVSQTWRMLVEGEYISDSKVKTSDGRRNVTLEFRSLFGCIESATNATLSSLAFRGTDAVGAALDIVANSRSTKPTGDPTKDIQPLAALVESLGASSLIASNFFPELMKLILLRIPVEAFYMVERKVLEKIFALPDAQIVRVMEPARVKAMSAVYNQQRAQEGQTLLSIINDYEQIMFYQHVPVLSPPYYGDAGKIPELFFLPLLYNVVPPACNVVFLDQTAEYARSRNLAVEPTRVITKLPIKEGGPVASVYMANNVVDSKDVGLEAVTQYNSNSPAIGATHTMLSPDELHRGVNAHTMNVNFTQFTSNNTSVASWSTYFSLATRHYFATVTGQYRTSSLTCVFLPYILVGVPCVVEDYVGPFHGFVESVTHILSNSSAPKTILSISQVRPAYVQGTRNKTPPLPNWLNSDFTPSGIKSAGKSKLGTWGNILGQNARSEVGQGSNHSAMVPGEDIVVNGETAADVVNDNYSKQQINMDAIVSKVFPVPVYDENLQSAKFSSGTIAEGLRSSSDPNFAMMAYNWRPGVSFTQYAKFHNLKVTNVQDVYTNGSTPPATLFDVGALSVDGTPIFASPAKMNFTGKADSKYGVAELARGEKSGALYNPIGQRAALLAQASINRRITRC